MNANAQIIRPTTPALVMPGTGARKVSTAGRSLDTLSKQWISRPADERFTSLDDLIASTKARAERTTEARMTNKQLRIVSPDILASDDRATAMSKANQLRFADDKGNEFAPTNWVFGQLASLAKSPAGYLKTLPGIIAAQALQYSLHYNRDAQDVKLFADDIEALALTGPDYGRIFNHEVASAVDMLIAGSTGDHRWKIPGVLDWRTMVYDPHAPVTLDTTTLFANDRGVFIFLCQDLAPIEIGKLPDGSPDYVFRGFYVTNSEVGAGALKIGVMYLRAICCNRILWGVEGFEELTMRHTKYAPGRFVEEAVPALQAFANGSESRLLSGVQKAKEAVIAASKDEALEFLTSRGMAAKRSAAVYDAIVREEWLGEENEARPVDAWTLAQGITAAARSELNFDARMDMEVFAGRLLDKIA